MTLISKIISFLLLVVVVGTGGCSKEQSPKPRGYYRIAFPEKAYLPLNKQLPYQFNVPAYARVGPDLLNPEQKEWITLDIPGNHAQIHISYKKLDHNLARLIEESTTLVYKHAKKASSIEEQIFLFPAKRTYGTLFTLKGNAASPMQFYLTDSTRHFLRGALYIKEVPNYDSLRPVIQFLSSDIIRMIESTEWK